jgi:hypothetical protein
VLCALLAPVAALVAVVQQTSFAERDQVKMKYKLNLVLSIICFFLDFFYAMVL